MKHITINGVMSSSRLCVKTSADCMVTLCMLVVVDVAVDVVKVAVEEDFVEATSKVVCERLCSSTRSCGRMAACA